MIALWVTLGVVAWLAVGFVTAGFVAETVKNDRDLDGVDALMIVFIWPLFIIAVVVVLFAQAVWKSRLFSKRNPLFRFGFWLGQKAGAK